MRKRILAIVATLAMVMTMIPAVAFADSGLPAADANGVIKLTEDVTLTEPFVVDAGETLTIDLNGYTISGNGGTSYSALIHVNNTADLTIKDSAGGGKIIYTGNSSVGATVWVEGNLILDSGTIELAGTWAPGIAVDLRPNAWGTTYTEGASFVMNGGEVNSVNVGVRVSDNSGGNTRIPVDFVMNDGEVSGSYAISLQKLSESIYTDDLSIAIKDGTVTSTRTDYYNMALYINNGTAADTTVDIAGGTFNGYVGFNTGATLPAENVSITDGDFNDSEGLVVWGNYTEGFKVVSGGTFVADLDASYIAEGYEQDEDGTVICKHDTGVASVDKAPTCTEDGYTGAEQCNTCGEILKAGEVKKATGHTFNGGTCTVCGAAEPAADTNAPTDKADADKVVKTGDDSNMTVPFVLAGLAVLAMGAVALTRRQRQN